jgi:uncharacterized protein
MKGNTMMYEKLKADKITAMKAKDNATKQVLVGIIDQAEKNAKKSMRDVIDDDVFSSLRNLRNKLQENIHIYSERGVADKLAETKFEISVIEQYLPKEASIDDFRVKVSEIFNSMGLEKNPKVMKEIMPILRENFGASFNGNNARIAIEEYIKL